MKTKVFNLKGVTIRAAGLCLGLTLVAGAIYAQKADSSGQAPAGTRSDPVSSTFRGPNLLNLPTDKIIDAFEFSIQHRFGEIVPGDQLNNFFGMDLGAEYRLMVGYPILKDKLQVELGRTNDVGVNNFGKSIDLAIKYKFLTQTEKNEIPLSAALYVDPAVATADFPTIAPNSFYANGTTPFSYKFSDRLSYEVMLILTHKFSNKFSLEISPTMVYQNLVPVGSQNTTFAIQGGARYKFSTHDAILLEYSYVCNYHDSSTLENNNNVLTTFAAGGEVENTFTQFVLNPISIGIELSTAQHVFHIMLSSTQNILGQDILTMPQADYLKGRYYLGFNISRIGF